MEFDSDKGESAMGADQANDAMKAVVAKELQGVKQDPGTPRVGDVVWYQDQYQQEPLAGITTHVYPGRGNIINVCVFMQRSDTNGHTRVYRDDAGGPGTWRPREK